VTERTEPASALHPPPDGPDPRSGDPRQPFDVVTELAEVDAGRFRGVLDPEWTIGGRPNGGYLLAMLGRAAAAVVPHDVVISATAHYFRSPDPGPVTLIAEVLRDGRSTSQVRARMSQHDRDCVEALVTVGRLRAGTKPYWDLGVPSVEAVAFDDAEPFAPQMPNGAGVAMMRQVDIRLDPDSTAFAAGNPTGRGELRGWLSLPGGAPFDPISLLFAVDAFPPATFDIEFTGWVPTMTLTVYVRALPEPGPVRIVQRAQLIDSRRVDEACFVWDRTGRLVAHGSQLAAIRLP
jgi:acyl-coenzyme A thioesterase PaaI-like protein